MFVRHMSDFLGFHCNKSFCEQIFTPYRKKCNFPMTPHGRPLVCWFLKRREVSLPCSYRSISFLECQLITEIDTLQRYVFYDILTWLNWLFGSKRPLPDYFVRPSTCPSVLLDSLRTYCSFEHFFIQLNWRILCLIENFASSNPWRGRGH